MHTRLFRIAAFLIFAFGIAQGQSRHIHFDYVRADTLRSDSLALDKLNMLGYILPWGAQVIPTTVDTTWWGAKQNLITNLADTTKYVEYADTTSTIATAGHSHYLEGLGAPAADLGVNGNIYYNIDGPTLYIKGGASWFQVYP